MENDKKLDSPIIPRSFRVSEFSLIYFWQGLPFNEVPYSVTWAGPRTPQQIDNWFRCRKEYAVRQASLEFSYQKCDGYNNAIETINKNFDDAIERNREDLAFWNSLTLEAQSAYMNERRKEIAALKEKIDIQRLEYQQRILSEGA